MSLTVHTDTYAVAPSSDGTRPYTKATGAGYVQNMGPGPVEILHATATAGEIPASTERGHVVQVGEGWDQTLHDGDLYVRPTSSNDAVLLVFTPKV